MKRYKFKTITLCALLYGFFSFQSEKPKEHKEIKQYSEQVGDIVYNPKLDPAPEAFQPCSDFYSYQYYNFEGNGLQYRGEKPQLVKELLESYTFSENNTESGYITIRFVVNCRGESGYYRLKQLDKDYKEKQFSGEITSSLLSAVKSLDGWKVKQSKNGVRDYHQYLTFKIKNGQIKSIVP